MKYMVDTCIFNWLVDGHTQSERLPKPGRYFITHVQHDELLAAPAERRKLLWAQLGALEPIGITTESMVVGVSRVGACKVSDGRDYAALLAALDKRKKGKNNRNDALIAETALKNDFTLISSDQALLDVFKVAGGDVHLFDKEPNQALQPTRGGAPCG